MEEDIKGPGPKSPAEKPPEQRDRMYLELSMEPVFFLFILLVSIFLGEAVITIFLPDLMPRLYDTSIISPLLLVVIISPILYLFSFRPLRTHIKELNELHEELRMQQEQYRSLVESTDDSIYLVDGEYKYLFMNSKHQSRMGLEETQFIGRPYGDFHSPQGTGEFERMIDRVFETGNSIQQEHRSHRDNRYFLRTFSPIKNPFGRVEAVTVVSKDITSLI
ncbi:MAG: PAS domain-containing protein [Nitrospirota bacterium]